MGFTERTTPPDETDPKYYKDNPFYQNGYGMPNCTCYAWGRFWEILGSRPKLSTGNAKSFYPSIKDGYKRGQTPKLGAVACWTNSGAGHVSIVERINSDGSYVVSDSHWKGVYWDRENVTKNNVRNGKTRYTFQGFIYNPAVTDEDTVVPMEQPRDLLCTDKRIRYFDKKRGTGPDPVLISPDGYQEELSKVKPVYIPMDEPRNMKGPDGKVRFYNMKCINDKSEPSYLISLDGYKTRFTDLKNV